MDDVAGGRGATRTRYELLASALAGRRLRIAGPVPGLAHTDGATIFLPGNGPDSLKTVVLQAALIGADSLNPAAVRRLAGRPAAARRYLALETLRCTAHLSGLLPRPFVSAVHAWWPAAAPRSAEESLRRAEGTEVIPPPPDWFGDVRTRQLLDRAALPGGDRSSAAKQPRSAARVDLAELTEDDEAASEQLQLLKLLSSPLGNQNGLFRFLKRNLGLGRRPTGGTAGADLPVGGAKSVDRVGPQAQVMTGGGSDDRPITTTVAADGVYPEWDEFRGRYRAGWCHVTEFDPPCHAADELELSEGNPLLTRRLAPLARALEWHRFQAQGDALDLDPLVEFGVARAASLPGDDRVYRAKRRTAPDLAVLLLLDASGSTDERRGDRRRVYDDERRLVAELASALERLGHQVAVYGFHSQGPKDVRFIHLKSFDERFEEGARRRLAALQPAGFTRMGAALRHGTEVLTRDAGLPTQVLIMVSDGFPYDDGYEGIYGEQDTRRALQEARQRAVGCGCITLAGAEHEARLRRMFGSGAHLRLQGPDEFPDQARALFGHAIGVAARQSSASASSDRLEMPSFS